MAKIKHESMLTRAALYIELYEKRAANLEIHSADVYQRYAEILKNAAVDPKSRDTVKRLLGSYDSVRPIVENVVIESRLRNCRMYHYPELDELLDRVMAK